MNKKALSPLIASIFLIVLALAIAPLILIWSKSLILNLSPNEQSCTDVNFNVGIYKQGNTYYLDITNIGNVQLVGVQIKLIESGSIKLKEEIEKTIPKGSSESLILNSLNEQDENKKLIIVPMVLAETEKGKTKYACQDTYGMEVKT